MRFVKNSCLLFTIFIIAGITTSFKPIIISKSRSLPLVIVYGKIMDVSSTFIDKRDGHVYKQIKVGNQIWMAENLNYGKLVLNTQQSNNRIAEKSYYKNDSVIGKKMGALYTWNEAVQYKSSSGFTQGLCPDGWHIPSDHEWGILCRQLDNDFDNSIEGWQGETVGLILIDSTKHKFNVKLSGNSVSNWFFYFNEMAYFWTSTPYSNTSARYKALTKNSKKIYSGYGDIQIGMNIRCIKD